VKVSTRIWAKSAGFTHKNPGNDACAPHFLGAQGAWLPCLAHGCVPKSMP